MFTGIVQAVGKVREPEKGVVKLSDAWVKTIGL